MKQRDDPFWVRLVSDPRLLQIASVFVGPVLAPGDVEVHHPNIVHGSGANTSPLRGCGLTIRYIPTSTRITDPEVPYPSAFHLQGSPGVNSYQPRPRYVEGRDYPFTGRSEWI